MHETHRRGSRPSRAGRPIAVAIALLVSMSIHGTPALGTTPAVSANPSATDLLGGPTPAAFDPTNVALSLDLVVSGIAKPVLVTNAGDGSGRLFVVSQDGYVWVVSGGSKLTTPFLDLHTAIKIGGEQGLLGLAFHPDYPRLPYFYVNFTDRNGNTAINRYQVSDTNPNVANRASGVRILSISQPYVNHNGGNLAFGPDGYLYVGMGDGGGAGDPGNRAQSLSTLLGKMLRIDINHGDGAKHYRSPSTNPYVGKSGLDEIWSRGLRNPWRWSFDRLTGNLWIADVGQGRFEEVDRSVKPATGSAGRGVNYGWRVLEGRACYDPPNGCSTAGMTMPLVVYSHSANVTDNCAVTGGFVYRGSADPVLRGGYVYGDYCSGRIWVVPAAASSSVPATGTLVWSTTWSPHLAISSFGEDEAGELYVCDLAGGRIYRIRAAAKA